MADDNKTYTEEEILAELRLVTRSQLSIWIREGMVRPQMQAGQPLFDELDRTRIELISTLCHEFEVNDDALCVFLNYLDQVHTLRRDMTRLMRAIDQQPGAIRQAILDHWEKS